MINFLFGTDKMIFKWGVKKCAELGGAFYLGAFEGAVLYAGFGLWAVVLMLKILDERNKRRASR